MRHSLIFFFFSFIVNTCLNAQDSQKHWTFSVDAGLAIPVGSYGKNDPAQSAIYNPDSPDPSHPFIIGFDKSKCGFAKTGFNFNVEVQYKPGNLIFFSIRSGKFVNEVETEALNTFLVDYFDDLPQQFEHDDYEIFYATPGIGVSRSYGKLGFDLMAFAGYARSNYPYYKSILLYTTSDPHIIWAHDGERPDLESLAIGGSTSINYSLSPRFLIGMECTYLKADFEYSMLNRHIPGGSQSLVIHDTLKVRTLNTTFRVGFRF